MKGHIGEGQRFISFQPRHSFVKTTDGCFCAFISVFFKQTQLVLISLWLSLPLGGHPPNRFPCKHNAVSSLKFRCTEGPLWLDDFLFEMLDSPGKTYLRNMCELGKKGCYLILLWSAMMLGGTAWHYWRNTPFQRISVTKNMFKCLFSSTKLNVFILYVGLRIIHTHSYRLFVTVELVMHSFSSAVIWLTLNQDNPFYGLCDYV